MAVAAKRADSTDNRSLRVPQRPNRAAWVSLGRTCGTNQRHGRAGIPGSCDEKDALKTSRGEPGLGEHARSAWRTLVRLQAGEPRVGCEERSRTESTASTAAPKSGRYRRFEKKKCPGPESGANQPGRKNWLLEEAKLRCEVNSATHPTTVASRTGAFEQIQIDGSRGRMAGHREMRAVNSSTDHSGTRAQAFIRRKPNSN